MVRDEAARAFRRSLILMSAHPSVSKVGVPVVDEATQTAAVDVTFDVSLPSEWQRRGESPSGVQAKEVARFDFPSAFPLAAPEVSLRPDFNRDLAHMQPWLADERPVPCIYEGRLTDLLHQEGLQAIVNQTSAWLERAALGTLIDPGQGWEPVRRDSFQDYIVADADRLRRLLSRPGGYRFYPFLYLTGVNHPVVLHGMIRDQTVHLDRSAVPDVFEETPIGNAQQLRRGRSLALVVWPVRQHSSEDLPISDTYLPETVTDLSDLRERAQLYGCGAGLNSGLSWLQTCLSAYPSAGPFSLAVILLAQRPYNLIGSHTSIELCPYVTSVRSPDVFALGEAAPVRPAAHHHAITRRLLVQMAGNDSASKRRWALLGAGSLGSKLAVHLARAGNAPEVVLDKSAMTPHNAARHALIPATGDMQILWMNNKATLLCDALRGFGQETTPIVADAVDVLTSEGDATRVCPKRTWAVVNATASVTVREALTASDLISTRVIETSLFAGGQVGIVTVEGPDRNPNTSNLIAEFYALQLKDDTLARLVFDGDSTVTRQNIGQGCGSLTMAMSDGRLSLFAAGMAEFILTKQRGELPNEGGEILIARLSDGGMGLRWHVEQVPPAVVVASKFDGIPWTVHIHQRAVSKIESETARVRTVETGGVLMGRVLEASRTVHIVDVIDAPEDSIRSAGEFVLGTKGLSRQIQSYSEAVGWSLYCLGTWHSHLSATGPSPTDFATARAVSLARMIPSVFVIHTSSGFCSFLLEGGR